MINIIYCVYIHIIVKFLKIDERKCPNSGVMHLFTTHKHMIITGCQV